MTSNHHRLQHIRSRSCAALTWVQSLIRNLFCVGVSTGSQNDYEFVRECTLRSYKFVEELNISTQIHCEQLNSRNLYKKHTHGSPHSRIYTNILISGARNCLDIFNQSFILEDIRIKCQLFLTTDRLELHIVQFQFNKAQFYKISTTYLFMILVFSTLQD